MPLDLSFDNKRAIQFLLKYLRIEGVTGQEKAIATAVATDLLAAGIPRRAIQLDDANKRIPLPTETGNLIVSLPGTIAGPRLLFSTHLDTVPLCKGAQPVRKGNRIVAAGPTALGGDNRTGVACLVNLATTLFERELPHPPLTLFFSVREESGLWGARMVDQQTLQSPVMGFNIDGRSAEQITIGAVGAQRWQVDITGRAAHAGVHPEQGISAPLVAGIAMARIQNDGWFGKISQPDGEGTSNVGLLSGHEGSAVGGATNVVTDFVHVEGESRSHDKRFVASITDAYRNAFQEAAKSVRDDRGRIARVRFESRLDYLPFRLKPTAPVVRRAITATESAGLKPTLRISNGGLDANWFVRHGIPTITIGAGQNNIHAIGEYVELRDFLNGCRLALALATMKP